MQHRRRDLASHPFGERELTHGLIGQPFEPHQRHHRIEALAVIRILDAVDVAQQLEALDHRQVPPKLCSLTEDHADAGDVLNAIAPWNEALHLAASGRGPEDAREDLYGRRFTGAVGPDEAEQLAAFEREADALERIDNPPAAAQKSLDGAPGSGFAFGDEIRLRQFLDKNLRHVQSLPGKPLIVNDARPPINEGGQSGTGVISAPPDRTGVV